MNNRKRKTNGMKIYCVSTIVLFAAVMVLSNISMPSVPESEDMPSETQSSQTDTVTSSEETVSSDSETEAEAEDLPDVVSDTETEETVTEETDPALPEPLPDPVDADNLWAMFLVNSKNPVSVSYCESIETAKVYESWREYYMDSRCSEYLKQMLDDAAQDGVQLIVMSAFRTVEYQQNNFDNSVKERMENRGMTYDEAYADTLKEVQLPGYSEHNAGVAADIMSDEYTDMSDDGFKDTEAYAWLSEHAADYGFILRYPEGKDGLTGIIYEPWHYRFVGKYYAREITDRGLCLEEFFSQMNWVDSEGVAFTHLAGEQD